MFRFDSSQVYRAQALEKFEWLAHGFGTRFSAAWPDAEELATVRQIHSDKVLVAAHAGVCGEGDALITNQAGLTLAIRTADCLPILIADPRHRAIAAVHAGWRGAAEEIVVKAVTAMRQVYGSRPEDLAVAIGPGIAVCCFEVGPEVAQRFLPYFPDLQPGKARIDLVETIFRQLGRNGVTEGQIATAGLCTLCRSEFHSYRRDRDQAGRMVSTIRIL